MKNKLVKILLLTLVALTVFGTLNVFAYEPYKTYTYSIDGLPLESPHAYQPDVETYGSSDMGLSVPLAGVTDMVADRNGNLYLADAGNNRIVVLNKRDYKVMRIIDSYVDEYGDVIFHVPLAPGSITVSPPDQEKTNDYYPKKIYREIKNRNGEVICGYYYNPDLYAGISFTESADDKMPVTVITNKAHYDSRNTYQTVESVLYALVALDFAVAASIYLLKAYGRERKV